MELDPVSAFDAAAAGYDDGRPGYPEEAIGDIARLLQLGADARVLDLGAGTGKLTQLLALRFRRVWALEPAPRMRAQLQAKLRTVQSLEGRAERIPLPDASVDAIFAAEAFHWFATSAVTQEMARVLTPRGGLVLLWNAPRFADVDPALMADLRAVIAAHRPADLPSHLQPNWREAFLAAPFDAISERRYPWELRLDAARFRALAATWSFIAALPERRREAALDELAAVVARHDAGPMPYRTDVFFTRRAAPGAPAASSGISRAKR